MGDPRLENRLKVKVPPWEILLLDQVSLERFSWKSGGEFIDGFLI